MAEINKYGSNGLYIILKEVFLVFVTGWGGAVFHRPTPPLHGAWEGIFV